MFKACLRQVRVAGMGAVLGLDFPAVVAFARVIRAPVRLVADLFPHIEPIIVALWRPDEE